METKKLTTDQIRDLHKPLPPEAVKPHPTKTYLSSIKAIYVVERLNEVFGVGQWRLTSQVINSTGKMVVVQSWLKIPEYGIELESYGGNDNADLGDAYKGATTDALTKMASMIGIGMDVYKGLGNGDNHSPQTPAQAPATTNGKATKTLPPFPKDDLGEYTRAIEHLTNGGKMEKIEARYTVSKELKIELLKKANLLPA